MKQIVKTALFCLAFVPSLGSAQELDVDWELYPDYSPKMYPDYSLLAPSMVANDEAPLPDHVNNGQTKFFPPVFNQAGGSCSMASRIGYMFSYEMNVYRDVNGKLPENRYPSHFVWLIGKGNTGKYAIIQHVGVPSAATYGGATYSHLFGNQKPSDNNFGWMQGYDKWYSAMFNRMLCPAHIPMSLKTEEGRMALKRWLYNHNGDPDYFGGGIAGVGVGINGTRKQIPSSPTNDEIGVTGMQFMEKWGAKFNHALTIVGYDDRVEFDLNNNGIIGEVDADERGAWIIVNSWGSRWANDGFIYCPYARAVKTSSRSLWWFPEIFKVRKNYRPLRTMKIKMDYSHRSEIAISAGISSDLNAAVPEKTIPFHHFQYAGDGKNGHANPAPAVPMLGKWTDGLHSEPMEFGYDLTDLSAYFNKNMPLKYFLIIERRPWAQGKGKIYDASIIDYEFDKEGIEVPFDMAASGVDIKTDGNKTILSAVVSGESYHEPQNLCLNGNLLQWEAPYKSIHKVQTYKLYCNNVYMEDIAATATQYTLPENQEAINYSLSALYENDVESSKVSVNVPATPLDKNECINFAHSGFTVPNIFNSKYDAATIEFWIRPNSLVDYNQGGGPGWDYSFKFHSTATGSFVFGWDHENRLMSAPATLKVGQWSHIAMVVNKNQLSLYVDGLLAESFTSSEYMGLGGFEELEFGSSEPESDIDAQLDEIRIWNYAKTADEINANKLVDYSGAIMPKGLMAYYKGGTTQIENRVYLRDYAGNNHARIITKDYESVADTGLEMTQPTGDLSVKIVPPLNVVYAGLPVKFSADYSEVANRLCWTAVDAQVNALYTTSPYLTFAEPGKHLVSVVASDAKGTTVKDECEVNVELSPAPVADFYVSEPQISSGEHITFIAKDVMVGYFYEWDMPGAIKEKAYTPNAATTYPENGKYKVKLKVTAPDGRSAVQEKEISVVEVAPVVDFEVAPAVIVKGETAFLKDLSKYKPNAWKWQLHTNKRDIFVNGQNSSFTPEYPGAYDVTLFAQNNSGANKKTHKRALIVCNADSKSGLLFGGDNSMVKLTRPLFADTLHEVTFDCWLNPFTLTTPCLGFGENGKWMMTTNFDGSTTLKIGTTEVFTPNKYVIPNEWHHYAMSFNNGAVKFYRDGVLFSDHTCAVTTVPELKAFTIGGGNAPFDGQIDEFRIWGRALEMEKIQNYANAPIENVEEAVATDRLMLYYDFNQSGGNVEDRTANHIDGQRQGFGPDGDAWGLSQGVFSLDLAEKDVTKYYLKNYKQPFASDGDKLVNPTAAPRFQKIADWTLKNATVNGDTITGVHVDTEKYRNFTITTGWDGFGDLKDHKAYQTIVLPAGDYTFYVKYPSKKTKAVQSEIYLVAAEGSDLPDRADLESSSIAYGLLKPRTEKMVNTLDFSLEKETEISLGLLINMSDMSCVTLNEFGLERRIETTLEADNANGFDLQIDATGYASLYLPYPTSIPNNVSVYTAKEIQGNQVLMEPITDGIVPAKTGVVVVAAAGNYHFAPSATSSIRKSLLYGVLEDETVDSSHRYYQLDAQDKAGFYPFNGETLEANHAYLVREAGDSQAYYEINMSAVGIEGITTDKSPSELYDLTGRKVVRASHGVYIDHGKKILVK